MVGPLLTRALGAQIGRRLAAALGIFLLLIAVAGTWAYVRLTGAAFARETESIARHYRDRVAQGVDLMEEQALRLKSSMDYSRVLLEPGIDWVRLKAFVISQQLSDRYAHVLVSDARDRLLFSSVEAAPPALVHREGMLASWSFNGEQQRLYRVFYQPTPISGGVAGHLVLVRQVDHALLSSIAEPAAELYLLWSGQVVASSLGESGRSLVPPPDGRVTTDQGEYLQLTLPLAGTDGQGALLVRQRWAPLFTLGQFALVLCAFAALLAAVLWGVLGGWLVQVGRRLGALDDAGQIYVREPGNTADIEARLAVARSELNDEIARVADSLQQLVETVTVREGQRDAAAADLHESLAALQDSEARFRHIFNAGNDAVFVVAAQPDGTPGRFLEANEVAGQRFGYSRAELLAMGPFDLNLHKDTLFAAYRSLAAQGQGMFERVYIARDGRHIPVEVGVRRFDYQGQPAFLTVVRDISERKQAERRVAELADLNEKIVAESTLGITAYRADGPCVLANEAMAQMVGASRQQLLAQNFRTIASWKTVPLFETAERALASGASQRCETRMLSSFGRPLWIDCHFVPFARAGELHLLLLANEITQYRLAEQTLRDAKQAAEDASRAKSEFLSNMSHEIRTPLNAIVGLTHLALASGPPPRQRDYLAKIELSSKSLIGIINDLLDFSKIEAGKLELECAEFALENLLKNVAHQFLPAAEEKGLELIIDLAGDVPTRLAGDALRLTQVLNNLVGNAVKFTAHGDIRIGVRRLAQDFDQVMLRFAVHDTGIGLDAEQRERLFQPFTQADGSITRRFGGTGLGLAISKRLVEQMGGQIGIESTLGVGSEFWFTVRLGMAAAPAAAAPLGFSGRRALVADDVAGMRMLLAGMLSSWGMAVVTAADGREALAALARNGPFDLVILDWKMPVLDGIETARAMDGLWRTGTGRRLPVLIMVTAFSREEAQQAAAGVPIDAIIDKPITPSDLLDAIVACRDKDLGKAACNLPRADTANQAAALAGLHVLVVEDNEINRQIASEILAAAGIRVSVAADGQEALDVVAASTPDAVLMDVHMPVLDGLEATRRLRRSGTKVPVIAMTAAAMTQDRDACLAAGMDDHVAKPIDPAALFATLARWTGRAASAPPAAAALPLPDVPGFALAAALERVGGKRDLLLDFLRRFAADFDGTAAALLDAVGRNDLAAAQEIVHKVKGVAGNLGAEALQAAAQEAEACLRRGEMPHNLESLLACLDDAVVSAGAAGPAPAPLPSARARAAALAALEALRPVLAQAGFVTLEQRERLRALLAAIPPHPSAAALLGALERIDYLAAAPALDALAAHLRTARG